MIVSPGSRTVGEIGDRALRDVARGNHHPDGPWCLERCGQLRWRPRARHALRNQGRYRLGPNVCSHAPVTVAQQAPDEVRSHATQPDHPDLHWCDSGHVFLLVAANVDLSESMKRARPADCRKPCYRHLPTVQRGAHSSVTRQTGRDRHLRELFADDPTRLTDLTVEAAGVYADFSKHRVNSRHADAPHRARARAEVEERRDAMFRGEHINVTEDRAVLHVALRMPRGRSLIVDGQDVVRDVHEVLDRMAAFCERVRTGAWPAPPASRSGTSSTSGSADPTSVPRWRTRHCGSTADRDLTFRFVSNVDATDVVEATRDLDPARRS